MSTLKRRIEDLERTADDGTGGGGEILLVELVDGGPDEETAIALARAKALAEGRRIRPTTGDPTTGDPHGLIISMVIVDMRAER